MKQTILLSSVVATLIGCNGYSDKYDTNTVQMKEIFPVGAQKEQWHFSDEAGNRFTISTEETIVDDGATYQKMKFHESKLNTIESHWFVSERDSVYYSPKLQGSFTTFLPEKFRETGSFMAGKNKVTYSLQENYSLNGTSVQSAIVLNYSTAILTGFTQLVFADSIGPIRMIDNRGRWPIQYDLDSAFVYGSWKQF